MVVIGLLFHGLQRHSCYIVKPCLKIMSGGWTQGKTPVAKSVDLSLIPGTHKLSFDLHTGVMAFMHISTNVQCENN